MVAMCWSGAAAIPLPEGSATAPSSMSSWGVAMPLSVWRWSSESVRVMVVDEWLTVLAVTSPSERPPEEWPASRTCRRS